MYHEKLIKVMHEKGWSNKEIHKGKEILEKLKLKEDKTESMFNYWTNIFFIFTIIIVTSISLAPILALKEASVSIILTIIIGLIFGTLAVHSIITLEDYNYKHHRLWGNLILFFFMLIVSYLSLHTMITFIELEISAFKYALIYKLSFAFFPAYITIKHEREINKNLKKIQKKIKKDIKKK